MESDASPEDVLRERVKFDEAWRKFVDAHESYYWIVLRSPLSLSFAMVAQMESHVVNLTVMSMDESIVVELLGVRTVAQMPISGSCIPREGDLARWPHLQGVDLPAVRDTEVLLLIGLKEKPGLFLPLEVKAGEVDEPVAIRYSLGWTVMSPMGERKKDEHCSVNFLQSAHQFGQLPLE